jgi:hypothetical protein
MLFLLIEDFMAESTRPRSVFPNRASPILGSFLLTLPAGAEVVAVGQGGAGILVVTRDAAGTETLRVLDPASGAQVSATPIARE